MPESRRHDPIEDRAAALFRDLAQHRTDEPRLAEPMERLVARVADLVMLVVATSAVAFAVAGIEVWRHGFGDIEDPGARGDGGATIAASLAFAVLAAGNEAWGGGHGRSVGKRLLGLRVVDARGAPLAPWRAIARTATWLVPLVVCAAGWSALVVGPIEADGPDPLLGWGGNGFAHLFFLGQLMALGIPAAMFRDNDRRGLHDHLFRARVVTPRD